VIEFFNLAQRVQTGVQLGGQIFAAAAGGRARGTAKWATKLIF
jgi:hypothetical protein